MENQKAAESAANHTQSDYIFENNINKIPSTIRGLDTITF